MKQSISIVRIATVAALIGLTALSMAVPALAGHDRAYEDGRERNVVVAQYVPLESIIGQIQARTPGRLVGVRGPNGGMYQIIWETKDGRVLTFVVDARTGQILR